MANEMRLVVMGIIDDLAFLSVLAILGTISYLFRKKIVALLQEREKEFCNSIGLTNGLLANSPDTAVRLALLVAIGLNKNLISDDDVIASISRARPIDLIYYFIFLIYLIYLLLSFIK